MARIAPQEVKISIDINKVQEFIPFNATIKFHYFDDDECGEEDIQIDSLEELLDNDFHEYIKEEIEANINNTSYVSLWYKPSWDYEQVDYYSNEIEIQNIWTNENY